MATQSTPTRIIPVTGTEANRATKAASLLAGEIHTTSDQVRLFIQNQVVAPVWHGTVADEAAMLALNASSGRGCFPGDSCKRTDTGLTYLCFQNRGTSAGDWVSTGVGSALTDPTTTDGDIIIRVAGALARLGIGSDGQVLKVVSGVPAWAAESGGGGGGGTLTLARFTAADNQPPASAYATFDTRNSVGVLDFDAGADEAAVFVGIIPEGADFTTGITVRLIWAATSATSGDVVLETSFERVNTDIDADSFGTAKTATSTTNGTSGIPTVTSINHDSGEIDGLTAGDLFRVKVRRLGTNGSDTMTGDLELIGVEIRQR